MIRASTQGEMGLNPVEGGFMSPDNGSGPDGLGLAAAAPDSPLDNILCKLSSMLEDCLFHMVDWVNRTEIFRVIRVSVICGNCAHISRSFLTDLGLSSCF